MPHVQLFILFEPVSLIQNLANKDDISACRPPLIPLSSTQIDRHGAYIMDNGSYIYLYLGAAISDGFCRDVLDVGSFQQIVDGTVSRPTCLILK